VSLFLSLAAGFSPTLAVTEAEPSGPTEIGIGAVALTLALAAFLVWSPT